jgi:hypothetical protein
MTATRLCDDDLLGDPLLPYKQQGTSSPSLLESMTSEFCSQDQEEEASSSSEALQEPLLSPPTRTTPQPPKRHISLARTSPRLATLLIPLVALLAHGLFYYAQTAPCWTMLVRAHVNVWANATTTESKWALDELGLPHRNHIVVDVDKDVRTFTYGFALHELWRAKGLVGKFLPRLTAVLLILCSGIWPHLKLFLVLITFFFPMRSPKRRQRFLHWLSTLGKWSLADVLTVCVMVAVLNLEWHVDPVAMKHGLVSELPTLLPLLRQVYPPNDLCTLLLKYDCSHAKKYAHMTKCKACKSLVYTAYTHPKWAKTTGKSILTGVDTSGGGLASMHVKGLGGVYAFCIAVILSIALSLMVDVLDTRARRRAVEDTVILPEGYTSIPEGYTIRPPPSSSVVPHNTTDDDDDDESRPPPVLFVEPPPSHDTTAWYSLLLPFITALVVGIAIFSSTMQREATGAVPELLKKILGIQWERAYSFKSLMGITGAAGGWDILLMGTFSIFIVFGPAVRAVLGCVSVVAPNRFRPRLAVVIDLLGPFCAWEVLFITVIMVYIQMPTITDTIVRNPACGLVSEDGSCLTVEFNVLQPAFALVAMGGFLLVGSSAWTVWAGRKQQENAEQYDRLLVDNEEEDLIVV